METFTPSLDWGNELIASALWVAKAWAIAAVAMLVVLVLLARLHRHGAGSSGASPATISRAGRAFRCGRCWACCCSSVMIYVRLDVLFSYQSNDQFSALQAAFQGEGDAKERCSDTASGSRC